MRLIGFFKIFLVTNQKIENNKISFLVKISNFIVSKMKTL